MRIVALGDCNTGHKSKYGLPKRIYHAWADILGYELPDFTLISRGVSGDSYQGMWLRWQEDVLDEIPDIVVVFGGISNFTGGSADPNFTKHRGLDIRESVRNMVYSAKGNGILIFLVSVQPFKNSKYWTEEKQGWENSFNKWMEDFSLSQGIVFINAYKYLEDPGNPGAIKKEFDAWSGYHLSLTGHDALGKFVTKHVMEVLNER